MAIQIPKITGPGAAAAVGAGLAAALLSLLVAQKTPFAMALGYISPLPIMIAALGFGSTAGLISVVVATFVLSFFDIRPTGLAFVLPTQMTASDWVELAVYAVSITIPAWLLARLAGAPAAKAETADGKARTDRPDEVRLGRVLAVTIGFSAIGVILGLAVAASAKGGFAAYMAEAAAKAQPMVKALFAANPNMSKGITEAHFVTWVTWAQLPSLAADRVVRFVFNLWTAARIAQASNLLPVEWPDIPRSTRVPRPLALALAVALGLSFAGGTIGMMSLIVSGALIMGFALQGLAVIHAVTRDKSFRLPALIIVYLAMLWLLGFYALLGLVDSAFAFRDREKKPPPAPGPWQPPPPRNPNP